MVPTFVSRVVENLLFKHLTLGEPWDLRVRLRSEYNVNDRNPPLERLIFEFSLVNRIPSHPFFCRVRWDSEMVWIVCDEIFTHPFKFEHFYWNTYLNIIFLFRVPPRIKSYFYLAEMFLKLLLEFLVSDLFRTMIIITCVNRFMSFYFLNVLVFWQLIYPFLNSV